MGVGGSGERGGEEEDEGGVTRYVTKLPAPKAKTSRVINISGDVALDFTASLLRRNPGWRAFRGRTWSDDRDG